VAAELVRDQALAAALEDLLTILAPRAGSLVVTVFGDSIATQGNSVWLGGLVAVMERFGLNARQIRTAIFRLGRDGWLQSSLRGRRSYYAFSVSGERQYARSAERIYAPAAVEWDGQWTLVTSGALPTTLRDELRRRLGWLGFGALGAGLLAHPHAALGTVHDVLSELRCEGQVVVWCATPEFDAPLAELVRVSWRLDELAVRFEQFISRFSAFESLLDNVPTVQACDAFVLRTLLIHEYRRILLKSTELPPALLPARWPGHSARALTARLYARLHGAASEFCSTALENDAGALPAPSSAYFQRFGGLLKNCE
jgi:phenylacetic acid degradation operon negative regulatory protein